MGPGTSKNQLKTGPLERIFQNLLNRRFSTLRNALDFLEALQLVVIEKARSKTGRKAKIGYGGPRKMPTTSSFASWTYSSGGNA